MELKSRIEKEFLPYVIKPGRYIGNEFGAVRSGTSGRTRVALAVPETYDEGVTDFMVQRLYNLLNSKEGLAAERVFLPAQDALKLLKVKQIPLFSLESFRPVSEFDLILFLGGSPLQFPQILQMLNLGGLNLNSAEREGKPIILGTGKAFANTQPTRRFLDGFAHNWSEKSPGILGEALKLANRNEIISRLSSMEGFHCPGYAPSGISRDYSCFAMHPAQFPPKPVVPFVEVNQDKLCGEANGDRWFDPGHSPGPLNTSAEKLAETIITSMQNSGFEKVKIDFALFPADAKELILALEKKIRDRRFYFELENLPLESFDSQAAEIVSANPRNRISFQIVAASQKLRDWTGPKLNRETILKTIQSAVHAEFHTVGLSVVIGLPTEHLDDIRELGGLLTQLNEIFGKSHRAKNLKIDFHYFAPVPGSAWQWDEVLSTEVLKEKAARVRENCRTKNLKLYFPEGEREYWKNVLLRGDENVSQVILRATEQLQENQSADPAQVDWVKAFQITGQNPADYARSFRLDERLPWDDLLSQEYKEKLRQARFSSLATPAAPGESKLLDKRSCASQTEQLYGRKAKVKQTGSVISPSQSRIRMKWVKTERVRFTSHLDVVRMFEKAVRRADFPVGYSEGFHPHPRIAYGPPLPLGFVSECEYVDMQLEAPFNYQLIDKLNSSLPEGFRIVEARPVFAHSISLSALLNTSVYEVELGDLSPEQEQTLLQLPRREEILVTRKSKESEKRMDIAKLIYDVRVQKRGGNKVVQCWVGLGQEGYARPQEVLQFALGLSQEKIVQLLFKRVDLLSKKGERYLSPFQVL